MPRRAHRGPDDEAALLPALEQVVGPKGLVTEPADMKPHLVERRGLYHGAALAVVKPATTDDVSTVVRLAAEAGVPVVPQGGNTGLVGGQVAPEHGRALVVNLARMNRIREIDRADDTLTVEAGCILAQIQAAAEEAGRLFPLSLAAEGSCQIGGNLATNAGGVHVLRYGTIRHLVLGLEVVLPDGRVWHGLRRLHKDNTGYDLKQLFIGAEGTLGIITAAVLRLFPRPAERATAIVGVASVEAALELLTRVRASAGEVLDCFEIMARRGVEFTLAHVPRTSEPLAEARPWYLLIELASAETGRGLEALLEGLLARAYEDGVVADAAIAASEAQAQDFWRLREELSEAQKPEGGSIKHDVSIPLSRIPEFLERADALVARLVPGVRPVPFGHLGDGNIHYNLSQPEGADPEAFLARWDEVTHAVHELTVELGGSISAEHGLGRMKVAENKSFKSAVEIDLMARIKAALDPEGLMNPGKVV